MTGREYRLAAIYVLLVAPFLVNGAVYAAVAKSRWLYAALEFVFWAGVPATLLLLARRCAGVDAATLGLVVAANGRGTWLRTLAASVVLALAWPPAYEALHALAVRTFPPTPVFAYEDMTPQGQPARLLVALWYALSAGLVEEVIYRGYFWELCRGLRRPRRWFLAFGPLVFAAVHWEAGLAAVLVAWAFGLAAAALYLALRNLWPLIVAHAVTDFTVFH
ncbi:MAG: CPBP family intramembrane glutamic endopeptidase [Gammaproteobacteria bacterium]